MSFFETLNWTLNDKNKLFPRVRNCSGAWSTRLGAIKDLRARLLDLQGYRCAYCQSPIIYDMVGHRELDHVLPKDSSNPLCALRSISNKGPDRRHTSGYPEFKFEPRNLVLVCKYCNSSKGTYDPLVKRDCVRPLSRYPRFTQLGWFHPHFQKYSDHIRIDPNFIYSSVTDQGKFVLNACGLLKAELLEKKFGTYALYKASQSGSLYQCLSRLVDGISMKEFSSKHAVNALEKKRRLSSLDAQTIVDQFMSSSGARSRKLVEKACKDIEASQQAGARTLNRTRISKAMK